MNVDHNKGRTILKPGEREDFDRVTNAQELATKGLVVQTRGGYLQPDGTIADEVSDGYSKREKLEAMPYNELQRVASLNDVPAVGLEKQEMIKQLLSQDSIQYKEGE